MDLTVAGFIIGAVALLLQISDAFPEHRETRKAVVLMSLGVFIGIMASSLLGAKYNITGNVDRSYILFYSLVGGALVCVLLAFSTSDNERRHVASVGALGFLAVFLLTGIGHGLMSRNPNYSYSTDEIKALADRAETMGNYESALERLEELQGRVEGKAATDAIRKRIEGIQAKQVNQPGSPKL